MGEASGPSASCAASNPLEGTFSGPLAGRSVQGSEHEGERPDVGLPPKRRQAEATITLTARRECIFDFEDFIACLSFLDAKERARLTLAGSEIFDNLVRHAGPLADSAVLIRAAMRENRIFLLFFFKSPGFASYAARCADHVPAYEAATRRWRGMGFRMCRNLAKSVHLRPGSTLDRIIIRF